MGGFMSDLYINSSYLAPIDYIISSYIREYDISKANISILLYKGIFNQEQFNYYARMDRNSRQVQLGCLQRDNPIIKDAINNGFIEIMQLFFEANDIQDHEVLSIKKDAIYLINKIPNVTKFNNLEFVCKNLYTSFYKIRKKTELYYYYDNVTHNEYLHTKGMKGVVALHEKYFLEFLLVLFNSAQIDPIEDCIDLIQSFYNKYINLELDVGYYRNFNNLSDYTLKIKSMINRFNATFLPDNVDKRCLDISYNMNVLMDLYKIYSNVYFQQKR
jgi:hypothetical protein